MSCIINSKFVNAALYVYVKKKQSVYYVNVYMLKKRTRFVATIFACYWGISHRILGVRRFHLAAPCTYVTLLLALGLMRLAVVIDPVVLTRAE